MRAAYPVIFTRTEDGYLADVPDIGRQTQGQDHHEAIRMARDLLGQYLAHLEDTGEALPVPTPMSRVEAGSGEFADVGVGEVSMIDVDTSAYRGSIGRSGGT